MRLIDEIKLLSNRWQSYVNGTSPLQNAIRCRRRLAEQANARQNQAGQSCTGD